uniref:Spermidine/spermine N1-acetyltransferase family member 2b n=1 Tax=Hippocampus comes TaxID=109280 RepID=A0A3Q3D5R8_HIPCM
MNFAIRPATKADSQDIWRMIRVSLMGYQSICNLERDAFGQNPWCETLVAEVPGEDKSKEGFGIGKNLLRTVAKVAREKQCAHLELSVLGQNIHSRSFYAANGAEDITARDDWHYLRFGPQSLTNFISCQK